ncbi:MAG: DegT/DnrJ/EryC1/StrS family aminotransferase [Terrimesophilobacter sp.]
MRNGTALAAFGGTPVFSGEFPAWPPVTDRALEAVKEVLVAGVWSDVLGPRKTEFEQRFASYQDSNFAVAVSNGTVSLQIALEALGVHSGHEVIVPAYTFVATATSVLAVNAMPVFVDVDPLTGNMDASEVEAAITPRTRAIVPVHFAGQPANMDDIMAIAERHDISVIEDAAQAHGARWREQGVGSFGSFGSFSFQASKNLTAGEGGALTTSDARLAERAWSLHHCGRPRYGKWYEHELNGGNHRMGEIQAALLLVQLDQTEAWMRTRARGAARLDDGLSSVRGLLPLQIDGRVTRHAHHLFCFRFDNSEFGGMSRDEFLAAMNAEGIPMSGGYVSPVNQQPLFVNRSFDVDAIADSNDDPRLEFAIGRTPISVSLCENVVWIPQRVLLAGDKGLDAVVEAAHKVHTAAVSGFRVR